MPRGKEIIRGVAASKGEVVAICRVVDNDEEKKAKLQPGEIMVTDRTTPDDVIYMKKAVAFVTNAGGALSHTAIVAREMGVPAVTGTAEATSVLKDGQKVIVDGGEGAVYEYIPDAEEKPAGESMVDKIAKIAEKKGVKLPPGFLDKMKNRE